MFVARFILLLVMLTGLMLIVKTKLNIPWPFAPAVTLTILACYMFLAGILNCMEYAVMAAGVTGIVYPVYAIARKRQYPILRSDFPYLCLYAAAIIYLCYFCYKGVYADGDTMTHWGVVIREMSETGRMPNFTTTEVAYQSYPTGTAGLVFLFCKIAGYSEGITLFAQGLLVFSLLFCMYELLDNSRQKTIPFILITLFIIWGIHFNVRLDDLKVDNVLPLLSSSAIVILLRFHSDLKKGIIISSPLMGMIVVTKNSGAIFLLFIYMCEVTILFRSKDKKIWKYAAIWSILVPVGMILLWHWHIDLVFTNAADTRHSTSIVKMMQIYQGKGSNEISQIIDNYFRRWLFLEGNGTIEWQVLCVCTFSFLIGTILGKKNGARIKHHLLPALLTVTAYIIYKIGLLGMYIFNMPDSDAIIIGAYDRYVNSIVILIGFITLWEWIRILQLCEVNKYYHSIIGIAEIVIMGVLLLFAPLSINNLARPDYQRDGCYRNLKRIRDSNNIPVCNSHILVYTYTPYSQFYVQYCFRSPDAWSISEEDFRRSCELTPEYYDYLIILDHDDKIDESLQKCKYPTNSELVQLTSEQNCLLLE